jgi:hypothetical protein
LADAAASTNQNTLRHRASDVILHCNSPRIEHGKFVELVIRDFHSAAFVALAAFDRHHLRMMRASGGGNDRHITLRAALSICEIKQWKLAYVHRLLSKPRNTARCDDADAESVRAA